MTIQEPALRAMPVTTPAAFLFTDIVNSTGWAEELGDELWGELLREHNATVRRAVAAFEGEEVAFLGDGFMLMFETAGAAFGCALFIQRVLAHSRLDVRIGLHVGQAVREGSDVYGRSVTLASRIADQASGGEILVSEAAWEALGGAGLTSPPRVIELKGLRGSHKLYAARPVRAAA